MRAATRPALSTQQQKNQTADAQEEEGDNHAIGCTETWFCGTVGGDYGRFDIIAALTVHSKHKCTHAFVLSKAQASIGARVAVCSFVAETQGSGQLWALVRVLGFDTPN